MGFENLPIGNPRLGSPAPDFEADTTHGKKRLGDYAGKWLVMFSHAADFTPVCTTEFIAFARAHADFDLRNTALIGLSVDSVYAHIAWIKSIRQKFGVEIPFPVIADVDRMVSIAYGMLMPDISPIEPARCTYIIDPEGKLQSMLHYPASTGRNIEEILRVIDALQTSLKYNVATPANWKAGSPVLVASPSTQAEADQPLPQELQCIDWYYCEKSVPPLH